MFEPMYQPVFNVETGEVFFYEALLRIAGHHEKAHVSVIQFAEKYDCIHAIDLAMLEKVSHWLVAHPDKAVAVNMAPCTMERRAHDVIKRLAKNGNLDRLIIEITETSPIGDIGAVRKTMDDLRERGVRFALDDFGCGYATEEVARELRPEIIKLDSWVEEGLAMQRRAMELIRQLGCLAVAEKISTEDDMKAAASLGIKLMQGFYLAVPQHMDGRDGVMTGVGHCLVLFPPTKRAKCMEPMAAAG